MQNNTQRSKNIAKKKYFWRDDFFKMFSLNENSPKYSIFCTLPSYFCLEVWKFRPRAGLKYEGRVQKIEYLGLLRLFSYNESIFKKNHLVKNTYFWLYFYFVEYCFAPMFLFKGCFKEVQGSFKVFSENFKGYWRSFKVVFRSCKG